MKRLPRLLRKEYLIMVWETAVAEFRLRDQGTFLGFLWTLLHPLIYFIVLYGIFKKWMGHHISNFPLYLIIGIVQWNFFASGTTNTIMCITRQGNYVKNINFPKAVLVLSAVLSVVFSHMLELLILIVFWLLVGQKLSLVALLLVPITILNIFLIISVGFIFATIGVYFLDVYRIWGIFTSIGLFLTPIFYTLELLSPDKRSIILLNPMTHIITATREILIAGKFPALSGLLYVFMLSTALLVVGLLVFKKYEGYFAEKI
ncbi:ABC transporter permease [Elusimicrobiota bacterium]